MRDYRNLLLASERVVARLESRIAGDFDDEYEDLHKAQQKFQREVFSLVDMIDTIVDPRSKNRAQDIVENIGEQLDTAIAKEGPDQERNLGVINKHLHELEQLFAGQGMLFAASFRRARITQKDIPRVFKSLRDTLDEVASLLEEIREEKESLAKYREKVQRSTYDKLQEMGAVPAKKPGRTPGQTPAAPRPKLTYAKAQEMIMKELAALGWKLSGPLKIPHATSPSGQFRLWFKAQAIYSSQGSETTSFKAARSTWSGDIRQPGAVDQFIAWAKKKA